jgi:hypothetical protein
MIGLEQDAQAPGSLLPWQRAAKATGREVADAAAAAAARQQPRCGCVLKCNKNNDNREGQAALSRGQPASQPASHRPQAAAPVAVVGVARAEVEHEDERPPLGHEHLVLLVNARHPLLARVRAQAGRRAGGGVGRTIATNSTAA